jgi:putative peptidoglycan lipid II flippase
MNLAFVPWISHAGLALSVGLGACVNAGFLYAGLRRRGIYQARPGWGIFFVKLTGALFLLGGFSLWSGTTVDWIGMQQMPLQRALYLFAILVGCGIAYFGALLAMGFRLRDFKRIAA